MAAALASIAVPPAGKCAGPIPAKNCTSCRKSSGPKHISITLRIEQITQIICLVKQKSVKSGESVERKGTNNYFPRQRFSADY